MLLHWVCLVTLALTMFGSIAAAQTPPVTVTQHSEGSRTTVVIENAPPPRIVVEETEAAALRVDATVDPGTHFLLEAYGGANFAQGIGSTVGLRGGVGGKVPGLPLRLYWLNEVSYSSSRSAGGAFIDESDVLDAATGIRGYVPIWGPVRIFGDALVGGTYTSTTLQGPSLRPARAGNWYGSGLLGGGVQFRILPSLSLGVRVLARLTRDPFAELRSRLKLNSSVPFTVSAGATWHL